MILKLRYGGMTKFCFCVKKICYNKKINYKEVKKFRDIPFNKDIYYAYVLIKINRLGYDECNILSAIILKLVNEKKDMSWS